jgi:hypothetical protein
MGEVLPGLWRFEAEHPDWTEDEGGEEGWDQIVAWWAVRTSRGLLLVDPLVVDWAQLDALARQGGGCAGVVRTIHWHERSVAAAAARYDARVWAGLPQDGNALRPYDIALGDGKSLPDGIEAFALERADEVALWLPEQAALVFGDATLRRGDTGELYMCPDSWSQPPGGRARLRELLAELTRLPVEHVLVAHGPLVLGDGLRSLRLAIS